MRYLTLLAAVLLVCLVQTTSASAAVSCIYHPEATPKYVAVTLSASGDDAVIERDTFDDQILVNDNVCGGGGDLAVNDNTDTVVVNDTSSGGTGVRIVDPRAFTPGATPEGQLSDSEIEFDLNLGGGNDSLVVDGTDNADTFTLGSDGLNTASSVLDQDADIDFDGVNDITVYGGGGADTITAHGGHGTGEPLTIPVTLWGGLGDDDLEGGDGADELRGGLENDTLEGGLGTDLIDGAVGYDSASYAHAPAGVTVAIDPLQQPQQTGAEGADHLLSVEAIDGSPYDDRLRNTIHAGALRGAGGNDRLTGSTHSETLSGGADSDWIDPGPEVTQYDLVSGGGGSDTVSYARAPKAVDVKLAGDAADPRDGVGAGDEIASIESVEGSAFADRIIADGGLNTIDGLAGSDEIEAGVGDDTVCVRDGEPDKVDCGDGADTAVADNSTTDALTACESADVLPEDPKPQPEPETPPADTPPVDTPTSVPGTPPATPDTTLAFTLSAKRAQRLLKTRYVLATVACTGEPCKVKATGTLGRIKLRTVTRSVAGDARTRVKVPLSRAAISRIRTLLVRHRTPRITLRVTAADAAGNTVVRKRAVSVK